MDPPHLFQEGWETVHGEHAGTVAGGGIGVFVTLDEQAVYPNGGGGPGERGHKIPLPPRGVPETPGELKAVSHIKNHGITELPKKD
jgi:hypothetical protein